MIFAAGGWAAFLLFWRVFDKPEATGAGATVGIQWGFFLAFIAAGYLTYVGFRIRTSHHAEPTRAEDPTTRVEPTPPPPTRQAPSRRPRRKVAGAGGSESPTQIAGQLSFEEQAREDD